MASLKATSVAPNRERIAIRIREEQTHGNTMTGVEGNGRLFSQALNDAGGVDPTSIDLGMIVSNL